MSTWQVRHEGSENVVTVPSSHDILVGLRDGIWLPTDEVKGPGETGWHAIEMHPTFAEAASDLEHPPAEPSDETHLDMNPLIDVCLVLLIFFILTITYESVRRTIDLPGENAEEKSAPKVITPQELKDKAFRVSARMDGENVVIKVEDKVVKVEEIQDEIKSIIGKTGKKQMFLDVDGNIPWGVQTAIMDAAKGNSVQDILYQPRKRH